MELADKHITVVGLGKTGILVLTAGWSLLAF